MKEKFCCTCKILLTDENGYRRKKDGKRINQFTAYCRACSTVRERARVAADPEAFSRKMTKWRAENGPRMADLDRERRYGISGAGYAALVEKQRGLCAICGEPPGKYKLSVDHNHETGKIRELLCGNCNTAIGLLKDSPERLRTAADYLERTK